MSKLSFEAFVRTLFDAADCGSYSTAESASKRKVAEVRLRKVFGSEYKTLPASVKKTSLGTTSGSVGGFVVPPALAVGLIRTMAEESIILPRSDLYTMEGTNLRIPKLSWETNSSPGANLFGGISLRWGFSQAPADVAEPLFASITATAWDLVGLCRLSNDLLLDLAAARGKLETIFARAAGWFLEYGFINGVGANGQMPLGILRAPGTITVQRGVPSECEDSDVSRLASSLLPLSWKTAIWLASPTLLSKLMKIPHWWLNTDRETENGMVGYLHGRPCFVSSVLPPLGSTGDLILCDPRCYQVAMRQEVLVELSRAAPAAWVSNSSVFRIWLRADGMPANAAPITLPSGDVVSPFVVLGGT